MYIYIVIIYVISIWGADAAQTEMAVFNKFMDINGIRGDSRKAFMQLCLLSAEAVLRGHTSACLPFQTDWAFWMRDDFLCSIASKPAVKINTSEGWLNNAFTYYEINGQLQQAVAEKYEAVEQWKKIVELSNRIKLTNKNDEN